MDWFFLFQRLIKAPQVPVLAVKHIRERRKSWEATSGFWEGLLETAG
jgi:hypothetical protein